MTRNTQKFSRSRKEFFYWTDSGDLAALRYEPLEGCFSRAARPRVCRVGGSDGCASLPQSV